MSVVLLPKAELTWGYRPYLQDNLQTWTQVNSAFGSNTTDNQVAASGVDGSSGFAQRYICRKQIHTYIHRRRLQNRYEYGWSTHGTLVSTYEHAPRRQPFSMPMVWEILRASIIFTSTLHLAFYCSKTRYTLLCYGLVRPTTEFHQMTSPLSVYTKMQMAIDYFITGIWNARRPTQRQERAFWGVRARCGDHYNRIFYCSCPKHF